MALAGTALKTARAAPSTSPRSQRKVQRGADIVRQAPSTGLATLRVHG